MMSRLVLTALVALGLSGLSPLAASLDAQTAAQSARAVRTAAVSADTAPAKVGAAETPATIVIEREVFGYNTSGRRDPYRSLMQSGELRPLISDLRVAAIAFDPAGNNSVAILRDLLTQEQYRIRVGQTLGRLRVSGIRQKAVVFTIEEFGFNRQEVLPLSSDSTNTRTR